MFLIIIIIRLNSNLVVKTIIITWISALFPRKYCLCYNFRSYFIRFHINIYLKYIDYILYQPKLELSINFGYFINSWPGFYQLSQIFYHHWREPPLTVVRYVSRQDFFLIRIYYSVKWEIEKTQNQKVRAEKSKKKILLPKCK